MEIQIDMTNLQAFYQIYKNSTFSYNILLNLILIIIFLILKCCSVCIYDILTIEDKFKSLNTVKFTAFLKGDNPGWNIEIII